MTIATMGRRMKKFATDYFPFESPVDFVPFTFAAWLRLRRAAAGDGGRDLTSRPGLLKTLDDHALARLDPRRHDEILAHALGRGDGPLDDGVVPSHHKHALQSLDFHNRALGNEDGVGPFLHCHQRAAELAGAYQHVGVGEFGDERKGAGRQIDGAVGDDEPPFVREHGPIGQDQLDRGVGSRLALLA